MFTSLRVYPLLLVAILAGPASAQTKPYPFTLDPVKAIEALAPLSEISGKKALLSAEEKKLFADATDGKLNDWSFAEAALIASGVRDAAARAKYLKQFESLEAEARQALKDSSGIPAKGKRLLEFLHATVMSKGYSFEQTNLCGIFDMGTFNCVSASVLYNVMARRLGLEVRAVEIPPTASPGHVFSVLLDGDRRIDVETTHPMGFDPEREPSRPKKGQRELGELGLVAVIYANHGAALGRARNYHQSIVANFCALALDASNATAAKTAQADLVNWGVELAKEEREGQALTVAEAALKILPRNARLEQNRKAFVQQMVHKEVKAGRYEAALERIREVKPRLASPGEEAALLRVCFDSQALALQGDGKWEEAAAVYRQALARLPRDRHLLNNLTTLYHRWSKGSMDDSDWDTAIRIIEAGLRDVPGSATLRNNLKYCREQKEK